MALEAHRSQLLPVVGFGSDGTLMLTNREGTYPLRSKPKDDSNNLRRLPEMFTVDNLKKSASNIDKNRSKLFKQRGSVSIDGGTGTGTHSTASSSLLRRLRRARKPSRRRRRDADDISVNDSASVSKRSKKSRRSSSKRSISEKLKFGQGSSIDRKSSKSSKDGGSLRGSVKSDRGSVRSDTESLGSRLRRGPPTMTPEFAATLERENQIRGDGSLSSHSSSSIRMRGVYDGQNFDGRRRRTVRDETLPSVIFIVVGALLIVVAIIRLAISFWSEFGNGIWAGVLVLCLGVIGHFHRKDYDSILKNGLYIGVGLLASTAVMIASAFSLSVLVPTIRDLIDFTNTELFDEVLLDADFSNNGNHTLSRYLSFSTLSAIWITLVLDLLTLVLLAISFYCHTATVIALDNHWSNTYDFTGDCDHRGKPRFFNPLEQMTLGQATIFIGILVTVMLNTSDYTGLTIYSKVWSGVVIVLAGFFSTCYGKRVDLKTLGIVAVLVEFAALGSCTVATVINTLSIATDVSLLSTQKAAEPGDVTAIIVFETVFDIVMVANLVFIVGILFRHCQHLCCPKSKSSTRTRRAPKGSEFSA